MVGLRRGFSLVELLVVIAIIGALAALILIGAQTLMDRTKQVRTEAIIGLIQQAVGVAISEGRGAPEATEHPLAGSLAGSAGRPAFRRRDTITSIIGPDGAYEGIENPTLFPASLRSRLILGTDLHAESRFATLFLVPRRDIGILGAPQQLVTRKRRMVGNDTQIASRVSSLISQGQTPNDAIDACSVIIEGDASPEDQGRILTDLCGAFVAELSELGAWHAPDPSYSTPLYDNRVLSDGSSSPTWQAHSMLDAGSWKPYRLPGVALYDAWGTELLITNAERGARLRIQSAGPDTVFRWHPGANGQIDASVEAAAASVYNDVTSATTAIGDDRRGDDDNITALLEAQP
ncbi:MAG: type II secretion system protein [Planctomycetota bacterium]|jgi:prepilin-type N-terminal cleavage/methylation domain-containing protein|nr:type II secretion system protein [Planctomycetota bacterium]